MTSLVGSRALRRGAIAGATCALFFLGCGSRSSLPGDGVAPAGPDGAGNGGTAGTGGPTGGGGSAGGGPPVCHLSVASPASIPLLAFPEGDADTPLLVVLDPGDPQGPSGPRPARVASQAISQDANFWHPELRIAGLTVDVPWPEGATIADPPVLAGTDAHSSGRLGPAAGGGLAVLWQRGDEAAGNPTGLKLRAFDTEKWSAGAETFIDPQGTVAHAFRAGKLDGTADGADGYVASWSSSPAIGAFEPHVAVLDPSGAFAMGPFAVGSVDQTFESTYTDVIWSGETHLIAVGAEVCADEGPPCVPGAMSIFRIVPPGGGGSGGVELVSSVPFVNPQAEVYRPTFARTGSAVWLTWSEWDLGAQPPLRWLRLARLDAAGQLTGPPELLAADSVPTASLTVSSTDSDLLVAWGEIVNPDLPADAPGHARIVLHHRDEGGAPIDPPLTIETTSFAAYPSISMVGLRHPHGVLVSWASLEKGGARSITYLSRLDCAAPE